MSWFEALFLGIVQGLTEFFPVSSSGHLVLIKSLMEVHQQGVLFELTVHAATLVAVLFYYRKRIMELGKGVLRFDNESVQYTLKLCVATVPAVLLVLVAHDFMERQFDAPAVAGGCLLLTGIFL
ncbi:MAG: undecaprenyl-diphosphate phosphatase, partial [bacterium]|nr:undecaprenyl-diphosphate phosphatase [bacterium]